MPPGGGNDAKRVWDCAARTGRSVICHGPHGVRGVRAERQSDQGRHQPGADRRGRSPPSKVIQTALEIWRDDVNAKGGLLGRPVQLVILDDQSTPANVPNIYTKLITVDKVDLLLGPYGTNFVAPAMPTIMQHNKLTISFTAIGINRHFNYNKYFSMVSVGPDGVNAFSKGFFELAAAHNPKPQTVAILAADAEFARSCADGAREELKKHGFRVVYDQSYPPPTTDFAPVMRAVQAANPDIVYLAAYPPDNVGLIRAANEIGLTPKLFGGAMIGMLVTPIKVQLGPIAERARHRRELRRGDSGHVHRRGRLPEALYGQGIGGGRRPARLCLGAVRLRSGPDDGSGGDETKSLDHDKLADYLHKASFKTVAGEFSFAKDGEWNRARQVWTQFQNVQPNNLDQFRDGKVQPILWPADMKTGNIIYPYADARKK